MDEKEKQALAAEITKQVMEALKPTINKFEEATKHADDKTEREKEEMAAGVKDGDSDEDKEKKIAEYRASKKPVSEMTATELTTHVQKGVMQMFRQAGGKVPAKLTVEDGGKGGDNFEAKIDEELASGAPSRGHAIIFARQKHPKLYNEFMARQHPNAKKPPQRMVAA